MFNLLLKKIFLCLLNCLKIQAVAQLNISPSIDEIKETSDLFIVLEDIELKDSEIGIIKNLLKSKNYDIYYS